MCLRQKGVKAAFIYQGNNEIGALVNGKITQVRVLGLTRGAEIGAAVALELGETICAPIHDPCGNVVALVEMKGHCLESYRYSAFGEMQIFTSTVSVDTPWRYSNKRFDPETGLVYFGRRYYAPDIGRWIPADPAGFAEELNLKPKGLLSLYRPG